MNFGSITDSMENGIITPERLKNALDEFRDKNHTLRLVLLFLVCFILLLVIVTFQLINYNLKDHPGTVMFITGMLAAASSLLVFYFLMELIPETFSILWKRKIIAIRKDACTTTLETQYSEYICDVGRLMSNSVGQLSVGLFFTWLVFSWASTWIEYLIEPLIAFFIGIMAWRVIAISIKIRKFGKEFYLRPQLTHADKCGGLKPLGNLCLCNALIVLIPGVYLGGWVLVGFIFKENAYYFQQAKDYTPLFLNLTLKDINK